MRAHIARSVAWRDILWPCTVNLRMRSPAAIGEELLQNQSPVLLDIMRTVKKCDRAAPAGVQNGRPGTGVCAQLLLVTPPKLLPTLRSMPEPLPKVRAGGDRLQPNLCLQVSLLHTSRPEALHKDAAPISASTRLIDALDANHSFVGGFSSRYVELMRPHVFHKRQNSTLDMRSIDGYEWIRVGYSMRAGASRSTEPMSQVDITRLPNEYSMPTLIVRPSRNS